MRNGGLPSNQLSNNRKLFLIITYLILLIFWIGVLTDYSWFVGSIHVGFSILVLFVSLTTLISLRFLPRVLILKVSTILLCILSFFMSLGSFVLHRYHSNQIPVQVAYSPDGTKFVEVYCEFTNAHTDGFDHIEIIMRYKKFPFLQRDIGLYNDVPRHCDFEAPNLIRWENNNTIYVVERQAYLSVGVIKGEGALFDPGVIDGNN